MKPISKVLFVLALLAAIVVYASESFQSKSLDRLQEADYALSECLYDMSVLEEYVSSDLVDNVEDLIDTFEDTRDTVRDSIKTIEDNDADEVNDERDTVINLVLSIESSVGSCTAFVDLYESLQKIRDMSASTSLSVESTYSDFRIALTK